MQIPCQEKINSLPFYFPWQNFLLWKKICFKNFTISTNSLISVTKLPMYYYGSKTCLHEKDFVFSYYLWWAQDIFLSSQKEFVSTYYTSSQNKATSVLRPFQFTQVELGWNLHMIPSNLWDCSVSPSEVNILLYTNLRAKDSYIRSCD